MAQPRRGDKQSNYEGKEGRANWSKETLLIFCGLCIEHLEKSKGKKGGTISPRFSWKNIVAEFQRITNLPWTRDQLKHKYDWMRARWSLWKKLKGRETGLVWDYEKRTIAASDEWWMKKIEEDVKFKAFRDEGIEPEIEYIMDRLFGGNVAIGEGILTPYIDPLPEDVEQKPKRVYIPSNFNNENIQNLAFIVEDIAEPMGLHLSTNLSARNEVRRGESPVSTPSLAPPGIQNDRGDEERGNRACEGNVANKSLRTESGRKIRCASMLDETLDVILEFVNERNKRKTSSSEPAPTLASTLGKLLTFDLETSLFSFACSLMEDPQKRIILNCLPTDKAIAWMKFLFEERNKK